MYHKASAANERAIELDRRYFDMCGIAPEEGNYNAYYRYDLRVCVCICARCVNARSFFLVPFTHLCVFIHTSIHPHMNHSMLYFSHKHAFLLFSAAMAGRSALVFQTADELEGECALATVVRTLGGSFLAYTTWPWMAQIRFGEWTALLADTAPEAAGEDTAELLPYTAAMRRYVRAFALASSDPPACGPALDDAAAFAALAGNATTRGEPLFLITAGQALDVANATLRARLAEAGCVDVAAGEGSLRGGRVNRGSSAAAVREWARAVALVDAFPYMEPPIWPSNLRACLGQALLDDGRFAAAQRVFQEDLAEWRGNGWSLKGLQLALEGQGKAAEAWLVARAFEEAWRYADVELDRSCF